MSTIRSQDTNDKTEKTEEDISKIDDSYNEDDKLAFNSKLLLDVNKYQARKRESVDSVDIKYSIDITNAPKKRLQEYLNSDLLDELEKEPSTGGVVDDILVNNLNEPKPMIQPQKSYQPYQEKKKNFESREGDWNCFDCHNLNFSFRVKCNRCGLSKEMSDKKCEEYKMNMMRSMMNNNNANYFNSNNMYFNPTK